ncbi:hypothetical protein IWX91DRAFT_371859 [Phyllosticta citricarpa]
MLGSSSSSSSSSSPPSRVNLIFVLDLVPAFNYSPPRTRQHTAPRTLTPIDNIVLMALPQDPEHDAELERRLQQIRDKVSRHCWARSSDDESLDPNLHKAMEKVKKHYGYVRSLPESKWYDNMGIDGDSADEEDEDGGGESAAQHRHNRAGAAATAKTKGHRRPWTAEDTALMLELKDQGLPYAAIAERLGRTDNTVAGRIKCIKERSAERQLYRIWTPEDNALLLTLRDDEELGFKTIAERLGRTKAQVVTQHKRLAVKEEKEGSGVETQT